MPDEEYAPPGIDVSRPNVARVYDYFLGGKDNFAADREVIDMTLRILPEAARCPAANRAFLRRVVRHLVLEAGIRQFIDIGSGLPTQGNVHQIAQEIDPEVRVVYVDNDPMVLAHAHALLAGRNTRVITADLRDPEAILAHAEVHEMIDFGRPIGLLLLAILHHITDEEDPAAIATRLRDGLPAGSHLAISHLCNPGPERPEDAATASTVERLFNQTLGTGRYRFQDEIRAYFGDWELLAPGLVPAAEWHPAPWPPLIPDSTHYMLVGGIARKP